MERKMLIRNIAYMERELSEMKKELALLDAQWEQQEIATHLSKGESLISSTSHGFLD
ncbi:hypothetical protein [uncultured Photobacterium sp.]|uniref:hypothetical protein n=1 Tax=uncultured Photobacterium sp. TaxID=173973 RepID=UPI00262DCA8B|nr:hypothetical protein [uncultured Photobacterium sp.]